MPKIGVLTGGGDCPGLNPAIRAIARIAAKSGYEVVGFRKGWKGVLRNETVKLPLESIDEILTEGGTILGTSRTNPYKEKDGPDLVRKAISAQGLECLVAIGGEDTLGVAAKLWNEKVPIVGIPKTIDNDLDVAAITLGFPTAVEIVTEAMDRIRTTARSHERIMVVEIMGRHAGWLAALGGIAGGADVVIVPETPMKIEEICTLLKKCKERKKMYAIVAIAEGATLLDDDGKKITSESEQPVDAFGHVKLGGIADILRDAIEKKTGFDTRATVLGHIQRGGTPSAFDRILSTLYGLKAMELVTTKNYGKMPALSNGKIVFAPLSEAVGKLKTLSPEIYGYAQALFG